jgi:hypothetical protein
MEIQMIEDMVVKEFTGLCATCLHTASCSYFKKSDKAVIQCELFEIDDEAVSISHIPAGLCKTCELASECRLPGRKIGTWHCNEFQ